MNFQVEVTSYCSITCRECPNEFMERKRQHMPPEIWDTILKKYVIPFKHHGGERESPPTLIPHKDGEALLNKNFPAFLRSAADADPTFKIDIYSHGLLLPRKPDFIPFLGSLPNKVRLMVSFHFYNHDGTKNDYAELTHYLRGLIDAAQIPRNVELIIVSHEIAPMTAELLAAWKADWLPYIGPHLSAVHCNASINPWTGLMEDVATCHYDGCPYADFGHMFFGATGNVVACCMDLEEEIIFGNVMTDDPQEMVAKLDAFYAEQRRIQKEKLRAAHGVCANCYGQKRSDLIDIGVKA
jgi:MoaA/NifB/PqqE/SkfB family radical SAM enzyme